MKDKRVCGAANNGRQCGASKAIGRGTPKTKEYREHTVACNRTEGHIGKHRNGRVEWRAK